jgi:hypothetical protein
MARAERGGAYASVVNIYYSLRCHWPKEVYWRMLFSLLNPAVVIFYVI